MRFNTVLKAMLIQYGYIWMGLPTPLRVRQYRKFSDWLYRRDEQQRTEIARLQAELDADDLMAGEAELFKPEYIRQLEAENVRLQAEIDALKASWGETLEGSGCRL